MGRAECGGECGGPRGPWVAAKTRTATPAMRRPRRPNWRKSRGKVGPETPGRPRELELELERGKVQEVGRGRVEQNSAAWSFPRRGRRQRRRGERCGLAKAPRSEA